MAMEPQQAQSITNQAQMLAYADDLLVFLRDTEDWTHIIDLLGRYGRASNAKINLQKTCLISLSGHPHPTWISLCRQQHVEWHDRNSETALRYLGYPLTSHPKQLDHFAQQMDLKIVTHANMLKSRHLSVVGSSLVVNSLLLS